MNDNFSNRNNYDENNPIALAAQFYCVAFLFPISVTTGRWSGWLQRKKQKRKRKRN